MANKAVLVEDRAQMFQAKYEYEYCQQAKNDHQEIYGCVGPSDALLRWVRYYWGPYTVANMDYYN